ncbi:MAG: sulfatase-like hydrolase/transferase [Actinomycetota bacterium]|nr:sulfatase-like hydrolase/transferase [Actinomycetota bacterium]
MDDDQPANDPPDDGSEPAAAGAPAASAEPAAAPGATPDRASAGSGRPVSRRQLVGRVVAVLGLASIAITQPLLDLLGANPEFFVSADLATGQIVAVALVVTFVPAVVLSAVMVGAHAVDRRAGTIAHHVIVATLVALFVLAVMRLVGVTSLAAAVVPAVLAGAAVAWVEQVSSGVRTFLHLLALSSVAFLVLFLTGSRAADLVVASGGTGRGSVAVGDTTTPVVMLVLDEFPLTSIVDTEGRINAARFPNLAALADTSTWFRNASSVFPRTHVALPSMMTGTVTEEDALPIARDNPRNLFTMLGGAYPINRYEILSDLCPSDLCAAHGTGDVGESLTDVAIVYGHRVLPPTLRDLLPSIDGTWGAFGRGGEVLGDDDAAAPDDEGGPATLTTDTTAPTTSTPDTRAPDSSATAGTDASGGGSLDTGSSAAIVDADDPYAKWASLGTEVTGPVGQTAALGELIDAIPAEPTFTFIHVTLPHSPWQLTPWGDTNTATTRSTEDLDDPLIDHSTAQLERRHIMQVGALDTRIGQLRAHLVDQGIWDDALVVLTSDHGANFIPPDLWRDLTDENRDDILRVPLLVKLPGQLDGVVRDEPASVIDIVPTIADVLDVDTDWAFDGHSLLDGSDPTVEPLVSPSVDALLARVGRHDERVDRDGDWADLVAFGPLADLVGTGVDQWEIGDDSPTAISFDEEGRLDDLTADGPKPYILNGSVLTDEPEDFLVAVNGRVAGIGSGFDPSGDMARFSSLVTDVYQPGANELRAYTVTGTGDDVVLHEMGSATSR